LRPPQKARLCYPCARNELSPLSQEGQSWIRTPDTVRLNIALFRQKKSRFRVSLQSLNRLRRTPSPHFGTKVSVADFGGTVRYSAGENPPQRATRRAIGGLPHTSPSDRSEVSIGRRNLAIDRFSSSTRRDAVSCRAAQTAHPVEAVSPAARREREIRYLQSAAAQSLARDRRTMPGRPMHKRLRPFPDAIEAQACRGSRCQSSRGGRAPDAGPVGETPGSGCVGARQWQALIADRGRDHVQEICLPHEVDDPWPPSRHRRPRARQRDRAWGR